MQTLMPLAVYAFVASITPGPNNLMLTSSGVRFGFARTIPHILGITVGFCTLLALCAAGIGSLVLAVPSLQVVLKTLGSIYLLHLAWQLRSMRFDTSLDAAGRPMSFVGAWLFQFVNPKCWVMAVTSVSAFLPPVQPVVLAIALFCLVFGVVNIGCVSVWAGTGAALRGYLREPRWQRAFCTVMTLMTVYAAVSIWR